MMLLGVLLFGILAGIGLGWVLLPLPKAKPAQPPPVTFAALPAPAAFLKSLAADSRMSHKSRLEAARQLLAAGAVSAEEAAQLLDR